MYGIVRDVFGVERREAVGQQHQVGLQTEADPEVHGDEASARTPEHAP